MEPVLTAEMLSLAKWLKTETICYEIDALQVMLPSAFVQNMKKIVNLQDDNAILPEEAQAIFGKRRQVNFKEFEKLGLLPLLKELIENQLVKIDNVVKQQGNVKEVRMVKVTDDIKKFGCSITGGYKSC